nr:hypothetical protein [Mammaliicoccus lentus]
MKMNDPFKKKYNYYMNLLSLTYQEAVQFLIEKHGEVADNYYKKESYAKFLNGDIKNITRGKYTKSKEGLYCHHILENKYENISNKEYITHFKYPYEYHLKENLVYCDLLEHLILHALITKETNGDRGFNGLVEVLIPTAEEWYIDGDEPRKIWMQLCRERAFLSKEFTEKLLSDVDELLKDVEVYQELLEEIRKEEIQKLEYEERIQKMIKQQELEREERIKRHMQNLDISKEEYENNEDLIIKESFLYSNRHSIYNFKADKTLSRATVLSKNAFFMNLDKYASTSDYVTDEFKSEKINIIKEDLIKETEVIIKRLKLKLKKAEYYKLEGNYNTIEMR